MPGYNILKPVEASSVPDWERRPAKWSEIVDAVFALEPGTALPVQFDTMKEAERARNAVRDAANMRAESIIVRTRLEKDKEDDTAVLWLTRVFSAKYDGEKK